MLDDRNNGTETDDAKRRTLPEAARPFMFGPGNKGRPKGSRHKLGEAFIRAMNDDFEKHGKKVIENVRINYPHHYLKVIASILPKEVKVTNELSELTDEQLAIVIAIVEGRFGNENEGRTIEATARELAEPVQAVSEAEIISQSGGNTSRTPSDGGQSGG